MGRKPLPPVDWGIEKVVDWDDAVREPPRPPQLPRTLRNKDQTFEEFRAEHERFMSEPNYVEPDEPEGVDAA